MEIVEVENNDSEDSIIELELPKKPPPPVILIEDEEIVLNVTEKKDNCMLAQEFLDQEQLVPDQSARENVTETISNVNSPTHWTKDMIQFYNDDWGDEDQFVVEKLQEKMDKSPLLWDVSIQHFLRLKKLRYSNVRCWNCKSRGHHFSFCPDPPYTPKCFMCGVEGHLDYYCPNAKCLNCGSPSREYVNCCYKCQRGLNEICSRCHLLGHNFVDCPDHWRLFHLTTQSTSVNIPNYNVYKSEKDLWCCNCGKRGHYQAQCMQRKNLRGFQDAFPFVCSYQRAFNGNYNKGKSREFDYKRNRGRRRNEFGEKILKLNPINKAIRKNKIFKHKFKKTKKNRNKKLKLGTAE